MDHRSFVAAAASAAVLSAQAARRDPLGVREDFPITSFSTPPISLPRPGNRSSIVVFYCTRPVADVRAAFQSARMEVTARNGQVRIAPALFNNADEIEKCLEVTKQLV